nr:hypothetical protein GCM10010200_106080 [Actinomadura rugatobispora]
MQLGEADRRLRAGGGRFLPGARGMGDVDVVRTERQRREPVAGASDVEREAGRDDLRRAGGEHLGGFLLRAELVDVHDRLGIGSEERREDLGQRTVERRRQDRDVEPRRAAARIGRDRGLGLPGLAQDPARRAEQTVAGRGQCHATAGPVEQGGAELLLERVDRLRDGRLGHVERSPRAADAPRLGDRDEVAELLQLDGRPPARPYSPSALAMMTRWTSLVPP